MRKLSKSRESEELTFTYVLRFIWRFRWLLVSASLIAGILAFIFSSPYFITPLYKSTVIFYPATTNSISKVTLNTEFKGDVDLLEFGQEEQAEQLLQLLQSEDIRQKVVRKYDLMAHYGIDPNGSYPYTKLGKKFAKRVNFRRTEYMSIEISVLDSDPKLAADMANDILRYVDSAKFLVQRERAMDALSIVQEDYENKQLFIKSLVDSLQALSDLGVPPYSSESSTSDADYYRALAAGNAKMISELKRERELRSKYAPVQKSLNDRIEFETKEIASIKAKLDQAKVDAEKFMRATFTINSATPAERKFYPQRSLIVLVSMIGTFAFLLLLLAIRESLNNSAQPQTSDLYVQDTTRQYQPEERPSDA